MSYAPYPIAAFKSGIDRSLPPWLIPDEAYTLITNAFVRRGVLSKRAGLRKFGEYLTYATTTSASISQITRGTSTQVQAFSHNIAQNSLVQVSSVLGTTDLNFRRTNTYRVNVIDQNNVELRLPDNTPLNSTSFGAYISGGALTACNGIATLSKGVTTTVTTLKPHGLSSGDRVVFFGVLGSSEINYQSFLVHVVSPTALILNYANGNLVNSTTWGDLAGAGALATNPKVPLLTLATSINSAGQETLCLFGANRVAIFDDGTNQIVPLTFFDNFAGATEILTAQFNKKLWFTGQNVAVSSCDIDKFITQPLTVQYSANSGDLVTAARGIISFGSRLLLLRPQLVGSDSGDHRQRILYSAQLSPDNQTVPFGMSDWRFDLSGCGGYIDLDTYDAIVGASEIKSGVIIYCERSVWLLRQTPSATLPFTAQRIHNMRAAAGPNSMLSYENTSTSIGQEALIATDGNALQRLDEKIPQWISTEIDLDSFYQTKAARDLNARQIWWLYPEVEGPGFEALVFSEESQSFSKFTSSLQNLGNFLTFDESPTWIDYNGQTLPEYTWQDGDFAFDSFELQPKYPALIGSDSSGHIYFVNQSYSDDGMSIAMQVKTKELNPFLSEGCQARLGYIDFLVLCDEVGTQFQVQCYCDSNLDPYLTATISCAPAQGSRNTLQRVPKRIFCSCTGNFHQIQITHSQSSGQFQLEGMVLYFAKTQIPLAL